MSEEWIAKIMGGDQEVATLRPGGQWEAGDEATADYLNRRFNPREMRGAASVLPFGHLAARRAALALNGEVVFHHPSEATGDLIS